MIKPKYLYISLTNECTSNCDFCTWREIYNKGYPKKIFPLVLGSIFEDDIEEIFRDKWKENEYLKLIIKTSPFCLFSKYLKEMDWHLSKVKSWNMCYLCYLMRNDEKFISNFDFKRNYKIGNVKLEKWKEIITKASELGVENLIFSEGGEPFLEFDKLVKLMCFAKENFKNIIVFTNAFFAVDEKSTLRKLKILKESGLTNLNISYDYDKKYKFHQSFIPERNIAVISKVAEKLNIKTSYSSVMVKNTNWKERTKKLEKLIGKRLKIKRSATNILAETKQLFEKMIKIEPENVLGLKYVEVNPRVEKRIFEKDIPYYKPFKNESLLTLYFLIKKISTRYSKRCTEAPIILENGLVLTCCSNAF